MRLCILYKVFHRFWNRKFVLNDSEASKNNLNRKVVLVF